MQGFFICTTIGQAPILGSLQKAAGSMQSTAVEVPVAQLDRASDYGSEGRGFESSQARPQKRSGKRRIKRFRGVLCFGDVL